MEGPRGELWEGAGGCWGQPAPAGRRGTCGQGGRIVSGLGTTPRDTRFHQHFTEEAAS